MSEIAKCDYYGDEVATLGERISVARERAGMEQSELAEALAIAESTLNGWENDSAEPRSTRLTLIAGVLGVTPGWLMSGIGDGVPAPDDAAEPAESVSDERIANTLLAELRDARNEQERIARRMARIEDALVALRAA